MPAAGIVLIVAVAAIVVAAAAYLLPTIFALRKTTRELDRAIKGVGELLAKTEPVEPVVADINANLDAGVGALEGLLLKKAGLTDTMGLLEGLYPGAGAAGLRDNQASKEVAAPRIGEVYTRGVLTLARLGREAPIAAASPTGAVLRHVDRDEVATDALYPNFRPKGVDALPRSPIIGTDAPVQYEPALTPGVRPSPRAAANGGTANPIAPRTPAGTEEN